MPNGMNDIGSISKSFKKLSSGNSVQSGKNLFQEYLASAVQADSAFERNIAPFLKNSVYVSGKNPMKFGIVQSTLRDYDPAGKIARNVSELDEKKAKEIYRMIWKRANCSRMSPELAAVHFNAYVSRPKSANEALAKSGGNPVSYADELKPRTAGITKKASADQYIPAEFQQKKQLVEKIAEELQTGLNRPIFSDREWPTFNKYMPGPFITEQAAATQISEISLNQDRMAEVETGRSDTTIPVPDTATSETLTDTKQTAKNSPLPTNPYEKMNFLTTPQEIYTNRKTEAEIAISGNNSIIIEARQPARNIDAYQNSKSKGMFSEGFFIKLRIPFS